MTQWKLVCLDRLCFPSFPNRVAGSRQPPTWRKEQLLRQASTAAWDNLYRKVFWSRKHVTSRQSAVSLWLGVWCSFSRDILLFNLAFISYLLMKQTVGCIFPTSYALNWNFRILLLDWSNQFICNPDHVVEHPRRWTIWTSKPDYFRWLIKLKTFLIGISFNFKVVYYWLIINESPGLRLNIKKITSTLSQWGFHLISDKFDPIAHLC